MDTLKRVREYDDNSDMDPLKRAREYDDDSDDESGSSGDEDSETDADVFSKALVVLQLKASLEG